MPGQWLPVAFVHQIIEAGFCFDVAAHADFFQILPSNFSASARFLLEQ